MKKLIVVMVLVGVAPLLGTAADEKLSDMTNEISMTGTSRLYAVEGTTGGYVSGSNLLINVSASSPSTGDLLRYNGTNWVNAAGYVSRGDPSGWDYSTDAFTNNMDSAFHDLDLSSIVPTNVAAVHIHVKIKDDTVGQAWVFRKNGHTNSLAVSAVLTQVANVETGNDFFVACDSGRVIEYLGVPALTNATDLKLVVLGWQY